MNAKVYRTVDNILGALLLIDGLYWVAKLYAPFGPSQLLTMFVGPLSNVDAGMVGFVVGSFTLPILPISIVILGVFMLALARTQPKTAIPLWLMGAGAFDVFGNPAYLDRLIGHDFWVVFQTSLMVGGWLLAGAPWFVANRWFVLLLAVMLFTFGSSINGVPIGGRPYEVALFAYIATSTKPRLWVKPK